jgi:hypothetical protein
MGRPELPVFVGKAAAEFAKIAVAAAASALNLCF